MTLEQLYEVTLDSTRSNNYYGEFDCFCETVFFSLCDGDTGDALKSYEVSFDEDTGEVDYDVEYTSDSDSGYCNFKRLPKQVREHVLAIVKAYIEEQAEEEEAEEEEEEAEEQAEEEKAEEKAEMDTLQVVEKQEVNKMTNSNKTLAQQYDKIGNHYNSTAKEFRDFEAKFCVSHTTFQGAGWSGFSLIFADGSVWGLSHNLDLSLSYATHFHDKAFNA